MCCFTLIILCFSFTYLIFCRFANLLLKSKNVEILWENILETSINLGKISNSDCDKGFFDVYHVQKNNKAIEEKLGLNTSYDFENITEQNLTSAAEMFIYLNRCPHGGNPAWVQFYKNLFLTYKPDIILMTLNRLMKTTQRATATKLLEYLEVHLNLKFRNITAGSDKNVSAVAKNTRFDDTT